MMNDPTPSRRQQVTLIPDIPVEDRGSGARSRPRRVQLPDGFDHMEAKAIHERWHRWPLRLTAVFSLLFLACCCLAVAALICAFIPPARSASIPLLLMAVVSLMLSVIFYKIGNRVEEKVENLSSQLNEYANRLKQMQYGLRAPNECDNPVPPTEWTPRMSECAEWAFGEQEMVLPSDTVVKFGWYDGATSGQGGYGIKREDKIVAEYITWRS